MRKRLLSIIVAAACCVATFAANIGDFVYTKSSCYYLSGTNLIDNGQFTNGLQGWTTAKGNAVSPDDFCVESIGPDGQNALMSLRFGTNSSGGGIMKAVGVKANVPYVVTYKAKSAEGETTTSVSSENSNYEHVFFNTDGGYSTASAGYVAIAKSKTYASEWTEITYAYTPSVDGYVVINFSGIQAGECFADFGVFTAFKVGDDRVLKDIIETGKRFVNDGRFPNGREDLMGFIEEITGVYESGEHDENAIKALEETFYFEALQEFLDCNTVNCNEYLKYMDFETGISAPQWKVGNIGGADAWVCTPGAGDRWMVMPDFYASRSQGYFNGVYVDYQVGNGTTELKDGELRQTADLPAGEYMLSISGLGYRFEGRTSNPDYDYDIEGASLFINDAKTTMSPLEVDKVNRYYAFGTVGEGEKVSFGVSITGGQGHWYSFDNAELRLIGTDPSVVEEYVLGKELADARRGLREAIDSAKVILGMPDYLFGRTAFAESIDMAQGVYEASKSVEEIYAQTQETLLGIQDYIRENGGYTNLRNDILGARNIEGADATLSAVIADVESFFSALTEDGDAAVTAKNKALLDAENDFFMKDGRYGSPASVRFLNETFANMGYGWETDGLDNWKFVNTDKVSTGKAIYVWRGVTAHDAKYVWQDVDIRHAGVYELSAEVIALNEQASYDSENTGVYLIAGDNSVEVHTGSAAQKFTVHFVVDNPGVLRIGLDGRENAVCNTITMGNVELKYFGAADKYEEDSKQGDLDAAREALEAAIAAARNYLTTSRNPKGVDTKPFADAIELAQSQLDGDVAALTAARNALTVAQQAFMLSGVYPAEGTCFDVTFAIDDPEMNSREAWSVDATEELTYSEEGGFYGYFRQASGNIGTVGQTLKNMPEGRYEVETDATFRWAAPSTFSFDWYNGSRDIWLCAGGDRQRLKGIVEGFTDADVADNAVTYRNGATLTLYDYTHATNVFPLLDTQAIENRMEFVHDGAEDLDIHIYYNIRQSSALWISAFRLYFLGDEEGSRPDGIEDIDGEAAAGRNGDNAIYNLSGQRVANPKGGIYIVGGRKFIVR